MGMYPVIFCDFKVRRSLWTVQTTHLREVESYSTGNSWGEMFLSFRVMVTCLYEEWHAYLQGSLCPGEEAFFESICLNTASEGEYHSSLERLSYFLARKSGRGTIVLIDECDAPIICAYEHKFFAEVRPLFPSRLRSRLRIVI
jgi:hypothetical protein